MEIEIARDLTEQYGVTEIDLIAWRAQQKADKWLWPAEVAQLTGLSEEDALSSMRKLTELRMLTNTFRKEETDFYTIE